MRTPILLALLVAVAPAAADTVAIGAKKDASIYKENTDFGNAIGGGIFAGNNNANWARRALLSFDVAASVPAGSTITGVSLTLRCTRSHAGSFAMDLHRLSGDWGEFFADTGANPGGSGVPAGPGDATWFERFFQQGASWTTAGGDFSPNVTSSTNVSVSGVSYTWPTSARFVADVQSMLDNPGANFGWILLGNETTTQSSKRFASREYSVTSQRPSLSVTYTTVPAPGALALLAPVVLAGARRRR